MAIEMGDVSEPTTRPTSSGIDEGLQWGTPRIPSKAVAPRPVREEAGVRLARPLLSERVIFGKVHPGLISSFCRQFASYLDAGVALIKSLESLRQQFSGTPLGPVIGRMALGLRRGATLTECISREPVAFDRFFRTMTRVAETRGGVPETLRMLANHYMNRQRLVRQSRSALIYPAVVISVMVGVGAILTIVVLPKFMALLQEMMRLNPKKAKKFKLPWPTQWLMNISDFIQNQGGWWIVPLILFGSLISLYVVYRTRLGKAFLDRVLIRIPVIGPLARNIDTSRFARTLSALLGSGIDIGTSLDLTSEVLMLRPMHDAVQRAREAVVDGEPLYLGLKATGRFPINVISVVESGEETGRLPEILEPLADDYDEQIEYTVRALGNLVQPLLLVMVGLLVLFVLVGFFLGYIKVIMQYSGLPF